MINFYEYYKGTLDRPEYATFIRTMRGTLYEWRMKEIEHIIKRSPKYAYRYVMRVLKCRWKEAEPFIMKEPFYAYCYSYDVINGRWLEAEASIKTSPYWWQQYCEVNELYD